MKRRLHNHKTLYQDLDVIILAAGFGMRIEGNVPKALIKVRNGILISNRSE